MRFKIIFKNKQKIGISSMHDCLADFFFITCLFI